MLEIPLQPAPSQIVKVVLGNQNCQIFVYAKDQGVFVDISVDDTAIVNCVIARNMVQIVCREYVGFSGNLFFVDNQEAADPLYTGLGSRWSLIYASSDEYVELQR
jgi:hypothetical protein